MNISATGNPDTSIPPKIGPIPYQMPMPHVMDQINADLAGEHGSNNHDRKRNDDTHRHTSTSSRHASETDR